MTYLLDTHTFFWYIGKKKKIRTETIKIIEKKSNTMVLSVASIWEACIKFKLDKLSLPTKDLKSYINAELKKNNFRMMNINENHAYGYSL